MKYFFGKSEIIREIEFGECREAVGFREYYLLDPHYLITNGKLSIVRKQETMLLGDSELYTKEEVYKLAFDYIFKELA